MPWAVIEAPDTDGDVLVHIMPVVEVGGFGTREEAEDFLARVESCGAPCLTDENDTITATYFGHRLSKECPCNPQPKESDPGCYIHKQAN